MIRDAHHSSQSFHVDDSAMITSEGSPSFRYGYGAIRSYLRAVRSEFPDLAIDDIALHRENIGSSEIEAQLRFVIFGRNRTS